VVIQETKLRVFAAGLLQVCSNFMDRPNKHWRQPQIIRHPPRR